MRAGASWISCPPRHHELPVPKGGELCSKPSSVLVSQEMRAALRYVVCDEVHCCCLQGPLFTEALFTRIE